VVDHPLLGGRAATMGGLKTNPILFLFLFKISFLVLQ